MVSLCSSGEVGGAGVVTAVAKVGEGVVVARFHRVVCVCVCVCVCEKRGGGGVHGCVDCFTPPPPKNCRTEGRYT